MLTPSARQQFPAVDVVARTGMRLFAATEIGGVVACALDAFTELGARACWIQVEDEREPQGGVVGHRGVPHDLVQRLAVPEALPEPELLAHTGANALRMIPLDSKGRRLGWAGVALAETPAESAQSLQIFRALANLCAGALDHAALLSRERVAHARTLAALDELRRRDELILQATFEGIFGLDLEGHATFANPAAHALTGWTAEDMLGHRQHDLVHHHKPDGSPYPRDECPIYAAYRDGATHERDDEVFWRKDGSSFPVAYASSPLRDETGAIVGAVVTFRDITERRRAEADRERLREKLEQDRSLLALILETLPVGVWITDETGRIVHGNPATRAIWEGARYVSPEEYGEYRGWWLDSGRLIAPHEWAAVRALQKGETTIGELIEIETFRGNRKVIINSALPIRDNAGRILGTVVVNQDVTKDVDQERQRDEWISIIAHDLRQPVNVIALRAELLGKIATGLNPRLVEHAAHIRKSAHALDRLIADLLDVSLLDANRLSLQLRKTDTSALVREVIDRVASSLPNSHVRLEVVGDVPAIVADVDRLEQILGNLLSNAAKYGAVDAEITVEVVQVAEGVRISVRNTGPGIDPGEQANLFRRFQRARTAGTTGLGLGLYITKGLVEAHGGRIWVESNPGETTTFHLLLPLHPPGPSPDDKGDGAPG